MIKSTHSVRRLSRLRRNRRRLVTINCRRPACCSLAMHSLALGPLIQRDKFVFGGIENFDGVHRVDFPDGATRKGAWSHGPSARTGRVAAIEEKLTGDS